MDHDDEILWFDIAAVPKNILPVDKGVDDTHIAHVFPEKYATMTRSMKDILTEKIKSLKKNIVTKARNSLKVQMIGAARKVDMVFGSKQNQVRLYM